MSKVCFVDGRLISQAFKTLFLETFPVFVELGAPDASFPAYAADVAKFFGQFERLKALTHDFGCRFHVLLAALFVFSRQED